MNRDVEPGMGVIVQTVARLLKGFVLLYGIYIVLYGHLTPGGGFAGGVVIACGFVLLTLAGGERGRISLAHGTASVLDSVGVLLFLALAWAGMWMAGGAFFGNFIATAEDSWFTLFSGGVIPLSNIGLGMKVASSLFLVFAVLAAYRVVTAQVDREDEEE